MEYDEMNRPVASGIMTDNSNYNNLSYHLGLAYTSNVYPVINSYTHEELTRTFFDDYSWLGSYTTGLSATIDNTSNGTGNAGILSASDAVWPYPQAISQSAQLRGLTTGTRIKVLGTSTYLYTVTIYDNKGRVVQVQYKNVTGGVDLTTTQYSWTGQPLISVQKSEKAGSNAQTIIALTRPSYDSLWRVVKVEKKIAYSGINGGALPGSWTTIAENEYNKLGQLVKKKLAPAYNSGAGLESVAFDYNIRGWLLGMNRGYAKDSASVANYFGFDLGYDRDSMLINGLSRLYTNKQYNGNIGGMLWKSTGDDRIRKYDFSYDAVNRLTGADFNQFTQTNFNKIAGLDFSVNALSYDANGNILTMDQKGWKLGGSVTIDSLLYTYIANSNKLLNVIDRKNDTITMLGDFRSSAAYMTSLGQNKTTAATDYSYDADGNMTIDKNKDISHIRYNHLHLPDSIAVTGKGYIKYLYDAAGNKQKKVTVDSTFAGKKITTTTTWQTSHIHIDHFQI